MIRFITPFLLLSFLFGPLASASITPNDPYYGRQWYLAKIKADSAWEKIASSPAIVVAVIDSGIQIDHPDLRDNIWRNAGEIPGNGIDDDGNGFIDDVSGWDFIDNAPDPSPQFASGWTEAGVSHGTMVAGIIAARGNNGQGVVGVSWEARIMALRTLDDRGEGKLSNVIRAIDYATNNGADIINLSFVSFNYNQGLEEAIRRAHAAGVIVVAAAGNEQASGEGYDIDKTPLYPACYDGHLGENMVIGVAATDALDQKAKFSSYGSRCVDIAAPGISFFSTISAGANGGDPARLYDGYWSGTSMATPLVSGALALIMQANPELSRREVVNILFASTDNITRLNPDYPGQLGNGRLNVDQAVQMAKERLYSRMGRLVLWPETSGEEARLAAANGYQVADWPKFLKPGSSVATGDLDGDGNEELVVGNPPGQSPEISIYSANGRLIRRFLAFDQAFTGGVSVATGDFGGEGKIDIIAGPAENGSAEVKIFSAEGKLRHRFYVGSREWRGGLSLAAGDVDGKEGAEIIVGSGAGSAPEVKIFTPAGRLTGVFLAYEREFRGGIQVATAVLGGRSDKNQAKIIVAPGAGREPVVKVFDNHAYLHRQFLAYGRAWQGGLNLATGDLNNDGRQEIALGARSGATPHVRIFDGQGSLVESFYAWGDNFSGGVNLGIMKINNP